MKTTLKEQLNRLLPDSGIESIDGEFHMRFELGGEGNSDSKTRVLQAIKRGLEIFNQLIGNDEIIITIKEWPDSFHNLNDSNKILLHKILHNLELERIKGPFKQFYWEENSEGVKVGKLFEDDLECDLLIGKGQISTKQAELIINGIAALEMGIEPSIPQEVSFFSINKQAGFRIYDDLGCDIWANSKDNLKPIYFNLNSWILDYNRAEIDKIFKTK